MTDNTDAIRLLEEDHAKVKQLLTELTDTTTRAVKKRSELLEQIAVELRAHTKIEEEIFYPAFRDAAQKNEQRELVHEAYEEHRAVDQLVLPDLEKTDVDTVQFGGRAKVLEELVEHHVEDEEKELFPAAKKLFDQEQLRELGARMAERKQQILSELGA